MVRWSGIKRCGAAMHMGQLAAQNIYERVVQRLTDRRPRFKELERMPPMMAVAIGKSAVAYAPGIGTTFGEEVAQTYFGDDLALSCRLRVLWQL